MTPVLGMADCGEQQMLTNEEAADMKDAARYRWLREQQWNEAPMCVVLQPRQAVKLGHDCPSLDRLDAFIDAAMAAAPGGEEHQ